MPKKGVPRILRVVQMLKRLSSTDGVSTRDLCKWLDVEPSTVSRDRELLSRAGFEIEAVTDPEDARRKLYRIPSHAIDAEDAATAGVLGGALAAMQPFGETDGYRTLLNALKRVHVPYELRWTSRSKPPRPDILSAVERALREERSILCSYESGRTRTKWEGVHVEPLRILVHDGVVYVHVWEVVRERSWWMRVSRMSSVDLHFRRRKTPEDVPPPPLSGAVWVGDPFEFELVFSQDVAMRVRDYSFGAEETYEVRPDGSLVVRGVARGIPPLVSAVLSWGAHARVVGPPKLKEAWELEVRRMGELLALPEGTGTEVEVRVTP